MRVPDELGLMTEIVTKLGISNEHDQRLVLGLIREIRAEAIEDSALACEHYAGATSFFRKAQAARECAKRIREMAHGD